MAVTGSCPESGSVSVPCAKESSGDAAHPGGVRWVRGRVLRGLAPLTVGLAIAATAMAATCTWQARDASRLSSQTAREMTLSQAYQNINSAANREYDAQLRYLSAHHGMDATEVKSTQIARFARAQSDLRAAVEQVKSLGGVEDKALAAFVLMEDRQYGHNARTVFAAVQAGQIADAQHLATMITGPRVDALISRVASAAAAHEQRGQESMIRLTERSRWAAVAIPASFGVALLLLGGCWAIVVLLNKAVRSQASALLAEKQLLSVVIESSPYFVYWKNAEGLFLGANQAFERLRSAADPPRAARRPSTAVSPATAVRVVARATEHERESVTPVPVEVGSDAVIPWLQEVDQQVQASGMAAVDRQATVRSPDGDERRLLFSVLPRPGPDGSEGVIGVGVDVTRLTQLERQLATASRLESVGRLAGGLAHEINTPIQVLASNVQFLASSTEEILSGLQGMRQNCGRGCDPAAMCALIEDLDVDFLTSEMPKALAESDNGLQRVAGIVRAMRDFTHDGQGHGLCQLNDTVKSVVEVSRHEWAEVADLHLHLDPAVPTVPCHADEIRDSLLAVIVNAAQAVADKREETPGSPRGVIEVSTQAVPGSVQIVVRDTGVGMDHSVQQRVFDPFFTTKAVGRGTGQGLAFAYRAIVVHHGGSIDVASIPAEGSTLTITLPAGRPAQEPPDGPEEGKRSDGTASGP